MAACILSCFISGLDVVFWVKVGWLVGSQRLVLIVLGSAFWEVWSKCQRNGLTWWILWGQCPAGLHGIVVCDHSLGGATCVHISSNPPQRAPVPNVAMFWLGQDIRDTAKAEDALWQLPDLLGFHRVAFRVFGDRKSYRSKTCVGWAGGTALTLSINYRHTWVRTGMVLQNCAVP